MESYPFDIVNYCRLNSPGSAEIAEILKQRAFLTRRVNRNEEAAMYEPSDDLAAAINVAIAVGRPLLLTGEPGTGKTMAAYYVAKILGLDEPIRFQVKSDSRARDLLYEFDAVSRFHNTQPTRLDSAITEDSSQSPPRASVARSELWKYVTKRELWLAFEGGPHGPSVLLIDEIDKAPRDFPNDLLRELEDLRFTITEIDPPDNMIECKPEKAPIVVITSNSERRLPEPFLRRCVCHYIEMTDEDIGKIVERRLSKLETTHLRQPFLSDALHCFLAIRSNRQLDKRPAIDEFWTWLETFEDPSEAGSKRRDTISDTANKLRLRQPVSLTTLPAIGCLVKTTDDFARIG